MERLHFVIGLMLICLVGLTQAAGWNGNAADNNWDNTGNWVGGNLPSATVNAALQSNYAEAVRPIYNSSNITNYIQDLQIGYYGTDGGTAVMDMTSGELSVRYFGMGGYRSDIGYSTGVFNMSGGVVTVRANQLLVGGAWASGGSGFLNMSGDACINAAGNLFIAHYGVSGDKEGKIVLSDNAVLSYGGIIGFGVGGTTTPEYANIDLNDNAQLIRVGGGEDQAATLRTLISQGFITANGGTGQVQVAVIEGVGAVAYVPEPATCVLLGLGALLSLRKRKA